MATLGNPKNTIEVLQKYNFNFQKKFGQNFLINTGILEDIIAYEGPVFGASAIECGNYANLDLALAKEEAAKYLEVLNNWENMEFSYPE